ncbi:hypothetical protein [Brevundimonas sp. UBA2416]|uniref:hypothetical protein n=1 Tax=Brevundimonas sp. UBA2416 TaxID=1946124 RepID=UPI0025C54EAF|nr:hypothetical protein [Brevundimonas sp. UBA2416]HRJ64308.1 hypothetical protein [Brevundimonas sp.]
MTDHNEDPAADIAWMRRLAEEGAGAPMQGASILMFAGLIFGSASLFYWAQISGLIDVPVLADGLIWLIATGLFFVVLAVVITGLKRKAGVVTAGNRASSTTWSALGWGIFALFASLAVLGFRLGEDAAMLALALTPSVIMVFYGIGWAVSATMYRSRVLWWLAAGSFVAAPLLASLADQEAQYLAYAGALFLLMALPGWMLMRQARA